MEKHFITQKVCKKHNLPFIKEIASRAFLFDEEFDDLIQNKLSLYDGIDEEVRMSVYSWVIESALVDKYLQEMAVSNSQEEIIFV